MAPSDQDVIERVRSGDTEAFAVLVERYHGRCMRYALHMVGDPALAQDLVQECFLRAFRSLGSYQDRSRFDRWLLSILANRARTEAIRRSRHFQRTSLLVPGGNGDRAVAEEAADPFLRARVRDAVGRLSPALREAVILRFVEELSYVEMSQVTGLGESALKMRVARAREALRRELEGLDS